MIVKEFVSEKLIEILKYDEMYKKYCDEYKKDGYVNLELLKTLIKDHRELLEVFYKINICLYGYDVNGLKSELKKFLYHHDKKLYLDDLSFIMRYYKDNYSRCRRTIKKIIQNKLVPQSECRLLKQILERKVEDEVF